MAYTSSTPSTITCEKGDRSVEWYHPTFIITFAFFAYLMAFVIASAIDRRRASSNPPREKTWLNRSKSCKVVAIFVAYSAFPLSHLCVLQIFSFVFGTYGFFISITILDSIRLVKGVRKIRSLGAVNHPMKMTKKDEDDLVEVVVNDDKNMNITELVPQDTYQDFSKNISYPILMFVLQVALSAVYITAVMEEGMPCFRIRKVYIYYLLGVFTKSIYTISQENKTYKGFLHQLQYFQDFWWWEDCAHKLSISQNRYTYAYTGIPVQGEESNTFAPINFWTRYVLSFIVNTFIFDVLYVVVNLEMAHSANGVQFVLNFVAALALTEYDNMNYTVPKKIDIKLIPNKVAKRGDTFDEDIEIHRHAPIGRVKEERDF